MSEDITEEASKDAERLAARIKPEDYELLKQHWQKKSFSSIVFMLRRYGIEFKGLTYLEFLVEELIKTKEQK